MLPLLIKIWNTLICYLTPSLNIVSMEYLLLAILIGFIIAVILRKPSAGVLITYIVFILLSTVLLRRSTGIHEANLIPFSSYYYWIMGKRLDLLYEIALNICLGVPIGFFVPFVLNNNRYAATIALVIALIAVVELSQYILCRGYCEIDDIINGAIGGSIGFTIHGIIMGWYRRIAANGVAE